MTIDDEILGCFLRVVMATKLPGDSTLGMWDSGARNAYAAMMMELGLERMGCKPYSITGGRGGHCGVPAARVVEFAFDEEPMAEWERGTAVHLGGAGRICEAPADPGRRGGGPAGRGSALKPAMFDYVDKAQGDM